MITVLLDKHKHQRKCFDCGVDALNNYLCMMANQQSSKDNARTFVLADEKQPDYIIGFYTLAMSPIDWSGLPASVQKKHRHIHAGGLIARLAVDQRYARQGFGAWLLVDALKRLLLASEQVAFPLVIVDAKTGVAEFYSKFGFTPFTSRPDKMFITLADVRCSLGDMA